MEKADAKVGKLIGGIDEKNRYQERDETPI
jgi:hypothetical protein